jgi:hypothetical protein
LYHLVLCGLQHEPGIYKNTSRAMLDFNFVFPCFQRPLGQ